MFHSSRSQQPAIVSGPRGSCLCGTGPDGVICWVEGVARGAIVGLSIAEAAFGGEPGVDGIAAGGFRQRAEIVNARMILEGTPADAGEWRFSALPWFEIGRAHV